MQYMLEINLKKGCLNGVATIKLFFKVSWMIMISWKQI